MQFVLRNGLAICVLMAWSSSAFTGQCPEKLTSTPKEPVVVVTPQTTAQEFKEILKSAKPGTTVILENGTYDYHNIRVRHMNGVTLVARNADQAMIKPSTWDEGIGTYAALLDLSGENLTVRGIHFDGGGEYEGGKCRFDGGTLCDWGGQLLKITSAPEHGVSQNVSVQNCTFTRSWTHAVFMQGNDLLLENNVFHDNCQFNRSHTRGTWPFVAGTWWYVAEEGADAVECRRVTMRDNRCYRNHGEGLNMLYVVGGTVSGNYVADNLFVNISLNNCSDIRVQGNEITSQQPMLTQFGNAPRAIRIWVEKTGDQKTIKTERITIRGNEIDGNFYPRVKAVVRKGGKFTPTVLENIHGLRNAISWKEDAVSENTPLNSYRELHFAENTIRNVQETAYINIGHVAPLGDPPADCTIDIPLDSPHVFVADRDAWRFVPSGGKN